MVLQPINVFEQLLSLLSIILLNLRTIQVGNQSELFSGPRSFL